MAERKRRVLVQLPADLYRRLETMAAEEERAVDQQAGYLLRRLLRDSALPAPVGLPIDPAPSV